MFKLTVLLGYAAAAFALYLSLRSDRDSRAQITPASAGVALGLAATLLHAVLLWQAVFVTEGWLFSVTNVLSLFGWELGLLAVVAAASRELRVVSLPLFCVAALASLLTGTGDAAMARAEPPTEVMLHVVLSLLAYGLLGAASMIAVFLLFQDRRLRHGHVRGWVGTLPPLFVTERLLFGVLGVGWLLLTLALASGFVFLDDLFAQHLVHKTVLSMTGWVILAVLLGGHMRWGWRGRRAVYWVLGSFALLLVAYFGSKAILEEVLGRTWG